MTQKFVFLRLPKNIGSLKPFVPRDLPRQKSAAKKTLAADWLMQESIVHQGIVRGFLGDGNIVRMAFLQARARDADELGVFVQGGDVLRAAIAHATAQAAHELEHGFGEQAL